MRNPITAIVLGCVLGFSAVSAINYVTDRTQSKHQATDNGLMTNVPNIGSSRVESVSYCLSSVGVKKYQDLLTDSQFVNFEGCLRDLT